MGAGSLKILAGVLVHRAARPQRCQRLSVLCFGVVVKSSEWSVPCVSSITTVTLCLKKRGTGRAGHVRGPDHSKSSPVPQVPDVHMGHKYYVHRLTWGGRHTR